MAKRVRRHIADDQSARTYCGKTAALVPCIDKATTPVDEAECKACQRSDDRRTRESYERSLRDQVRGYAIASAKLFAKQFPGKVIFPSVPDRIESAWLLVPEALREARWAWREYRNAFSDVLIKAFREARETAGPGLVSTRPVGPTKEGASP